MSTSDFFKSALAASDGGVIRPMKKPMTTDEDQKAQDCADKIVDNMCGPTMDTAYGEDLWEEIDRIVSISNVRERMDMIEDLTLLDLMKKAAKRRVKAMIERGDFQ